VISAHGKLEDFATKRIRNEHVRNKLIDKNHEAKTLFDVIELLFKRLVTDYPLAQAQRVVSIVQSGKKDASFQVQQEIRAANSMILKRCKNGLIKRLEVNRDEKLTKLISNSTSKKDIPSEIIEVLC